MNAPKLTAQFFAHHYGAKDEVAIDPANYWTLSLIADNLCFRIPLRTHTVFDPKILDDISKRLSNSLPSGVAAFQADLDHNLKSMLEAALSKLDLVTMKEFQIQQAVLLRTREKLAALEQRVEALESTHLK